MTGRIIFSDIDGTIVHYDAEVPPAADAELLVMPRSSTGKQGVIARATLQRIAALRAQGFKFVLVSGARTSTLLMRLPYLPAADAYVTENGGRVFLPDPSLPTACPILEDPVWAEVHEKATGPLQQALLLAPEKRSGLLWDWYRKLTSQGWACDAEGYATSFRLRGTVAGGAPVTEAQLAEVCAAAPAGLAYSVNLGTLDFYPATSGKAAAAAYLAQRLAVQHGGGGEGSAASGPKAEAPPSLKDCVFLCDDDNDLELGRAVGRAFVPGTTSESMAAAVAAEPGQFVRASGPHGHGATLEMLDAAAAYLGAATS